MTGKQPIDGRDLDAASELQELLDTWGGAAERWPAAARGRIEALLVSAPGARAMLEEARALDRLIDEGRDTPALLSVPAQNALTDRIMAVAIAGASPSLAVAARDGKVVPFPGGRRLDVTAQLAGRVAARAGRAEVALPPRQVWRATAVMAASLVMGILLGGNLNFAPVVQELIEVAGLSADVDPAVTDDLGEDETL